MKLLNKMERKFGRYAIPNLTKFLLGAYVIGYLIEFTAPAIMTWLTLNPYYIMRGQIWRIITWVLIPPEGFSIFTIIMLFFYYWLGGNLERTWGTFRYNFYIFGGLFLTIIGAFVLYFICLITGSYQQMAFGVFSTYYINLSIFLAFAASYPDMQIIVYFIVPVKVKWIAYLDVAYLIYEIYQYIRFGLWGGVVVIIVSLLNFIIFFLMTRNYRRISPKEIHRKQAYRRQVNNARTITIHKCAICGRTDKDNPTLEFRFCSKCNGNYEYCQEHLYTHQHVQ